MIWNNIAIILLQFLRSSRLNRGKSSILNTGSWKDWVSQYILSDSERLYHTQRLGEPMLLIGTQQSWMIKMDTSWRNNNEAAFCVAWLTSTCQNKILCWHLTIIYKSARGGNRIHLPYCTVLFGALLFILVLRWWWFDSFDSPRLACPAPPNNAKFLRH